MKRNALGLTLIALLVLGCGRHKPLPAVTDAGVDLLDSGFPGSNAPRPPSGSGSTPASGAEEEEGTAYLPLPESSAPSSPTVPVPPPPLPLPPLPAGGTPPPLPLAEILPIGEPPCAIRRLQPGEVSSAAGPSPAFVVNRPLRALVPRFRWGHRLALKPPPTWCGDISVGVWLVHRRLGAYVPGSGGKGEGVALRLPCRGANCFRGYFKFTRRYLTQTWEIPAEDLAPLWAYVRPGDAFDLVFDWVHYAGGCGTGDVNDFAYRNGYSFGYHFGPADRPTPPISCL